MDLCISEKESAFRAIVREWIRSNLPELASRKMREGVPLDKEDYQGWARKLGRKGWLAVTWPKEFGGPGWSAIERYIFVQECTLADAPPVLPFGPNMLAPLLMKFGSREQQERFLPDIFSGSSWWCQGFSEPNSGSDLASLKTRADRDGDSFVINGQKTWTSFAQYADWIFCLVRTKDGTKSQTHISLLLIDMRSPGVTVRPIRLLDGSEEVNEVWFDNVVVPLDNLVGHEKDGWLHAQHILLEERSNSAETSKAKRGVLRLIDVAKAHHKLDDHRFRDELAKLQVEVTALEMLQLRAIDSAPVKSQSLNTAALLKIRSSEIQQRCSELMMLLLGFDSLSICEVSLDSHSATLSPSPLALTYANMRKASIYGGTNEMQRSIIAQELLQ